MLNNMASFWLSVCLTAFIVPSGPGADFHPLQGGLHTQGMAGISPGFLCRRILVLRQGRIPSQIFNTLLIHKHILLTRDAQILHLLQL